MPAPPGVRLEIEFVPGVWTDVTADMDWVTGWTIHVGRTSPTQQPAPATFTVQVHNLTGKYTPGAQTLSDGSPAPYYPNVKRRKRIRASYGSGAHIRFVGYIKSWAPLLDGGTSGIVVVQASDRLDTLGRAGMLPVFGQIAHDTEPALYWPLTDAAGSTSAFESMGDDNPLHVTGLTGPQSAAPLTFGSAGPPTDDGTGVAFAPTASDIGQILQLQRTDRAGVDFTSPYTIFLLVNVAKPLPAWSVRQGILGLGNLLTASATLTVSLSHDVVEVGNGVTHLVGHTSIVDGAWHSIIVTVLPDLTAAHSTALVDGVSLGDINIQPNGGDLLRIGDSVLADTGRFRGSIAHVMLFDRVLSSDEKAALVNATSGFYGELVGARVARYLGYGGLTSSDWSVSTSQVRAGTYAQGGTTVAAAIQDMATTEAAGAVAYVRADGLTAFTSRDDRRPAAPTLILDAEQDLNAPDYAPIDDDTIAANRAIVTRSSQGGADSKLVWDAVDQTDGVIEATATTNTASNADALHVAQWLVASGQFEGLRFPKVGVDLLHAANDLYAATAATVIGSRIRVTNIPASQMPATQVDAIVEGWTETGNVASYSVVFDTSPADAPAMCVCDDAVYGRAQAVAGTLTLNADVTLSAGTVVVASTGLTFTTDPTTYPLAIQCGAEHMAVTAAPAGAGSPQTLAVTRGVDGTTPSAHTAGSAVDLWPVATACL